MPNGRRLLKKLFLNIIQHVLAMHCAGYEARFIFAAIYLFIHYLITALFTFCIIYILILLGTCNLIAEPISFGKGTRALSSLSGPA